MKQRLAILDRQLNNHSYSSKHRAVFVSAMTESTIEGGELPESLVDGLMTRTPIGVLLALFAGVGKDEDVGFIMAIVAVADKKLAFVEFIYELFPEDVTVRLSGAVGAVDPHDIVNTEIQAEFICNSWTTEFVRVPTIP